MSLTLTPRLSRLLAVLLLVTAIMALWQLAVEPLIELVEGKRESIAQAQRMLAAYRRVAGRQPQLQAELGALKSRQGAESGLLDGANATLATAALQNSVRRIVEGAGGALRSVQVLPAAREQDFQRLGLRIELAADSRKLRDLVHSLEAATPYLFLDNLDLRAPEATAPGQARAETPLTIRCEVYAYMRAGGA